MYQFYQSELCKQASDTLILNGKSERTRLAYLRQVRLLSQIYHQTNTLECALENLTFFRVLGIKWRLIFAGLCKNE